MMAFCRVIQFLNEVRQNELNEYKVVLKRKGR